MSLLPEPVPLDPPPGSPDAVDDAAQATSAAARLLDELADGLARATTVPWQGADADATEARRGRIARLAADGAAALHRTAVRLTGHAEVLREVRARVAVLHAAQDREFAAARSRVAVPFDPMDPLAPDPAVVIAALGVADKDRSAEHARLTARVDDDAAATIRALADAASLVAGTSRHDPDTALLRLAALLPAWGTPEVARRGFLLASAAGGGRGEGMDTDALRAAATEDLDLARDPAYAAAFLEALDSSLAIPWLSTAWGGAAADDPRTDLLARVLSALDRRSSGPPWLAALLDDARRTGELATVAGGLGAVLARGRATGLPGPPPALAAAWARSLVRAEEATGHPTDLGLPPAGADPAASDPLALLADAVVRQRASLEAARLLADRGSWAVMLSRSWNDPALRNSLTLTVADAPAEAARRALRQGLVAIGTGLEDGDPDDWPFVAGRITEVAPILATALLRHPEVLAEPLARVAAGAADPVSVTALRGLAVTVALDEGTDPRSRGVVGDRIARALSHPHPDALPDHPGAAEAAVPAAVAAAVPAAFVAVREHGARLAHAMDQHGRRERAEAKAYIWDRTIGLGFTVAGAIPVWGRLATPAEVLVTHALGTGGAYTNTPDRYQHHPATEALSAVAHLEQGSPQPGAAREALLTYTRTLQVLGTPVAPIAPDDGLAEKLVQETAADVLGGMVGRRLRVTDGLDGVVGGALVDEATDLADDSG